MRRALCVLVALTCGCSNEPTSPEPAADAEPAAAPADISALPTPSLSRSGRLPPIPAQPIERAEGACGYSVDISSLFGLSARHLRDVGLGNTTPIILLEDGKPLPAFAERDDYEERCTGAFNVGRNVVRFSPTDDADKHDYTVTLSDALPMPTPDGPAWWVYTEHTLSADFDSDGGQAGNTVTVTAAARSPQNQAKAIPALVLGGQRAEFTETSPHHWEATLTTTVPAGAWSVQIDSPGDGPYLLIDRWAVSAEGKTLDLLAVPEAAAAAVGVPVAGGTLLPPDAVRFSGPPPALPASETVAIGELAAKITLDALAPLSTNQVGDVLGVKYSPVRVLEDGKALEIPMSPCPKVKREGGSQYCHSHNVLLFGASDGSSPASNGRSYTLALDPERHFVGGWWLYPEDTLIGATFQGTSATVEARAITEDATLTVALRDSSGAAIAEQTFDAAALAAGPVAVSADATGTYALELRASGHVVAQDARAD